MKTHHKFICPACQRLEKEAGVTLCRYDAVQLQRMTDVVMLIREKYPSLMTTAGSAILLRFWAKFVATDVKAMGAVRALAAQWRGDGLETTEDLTPDPVGLF